MEFSAILKSAGRTSSSDEFVEISKYVLEHHERFDGNRLSEGLERA